jgi:DNA (cytosine-5)-methyltransferase 1
MADRPRLLDLFCGAGGAAVGYHRAGFEVVGVDVANQPRYPFEFHQADALEFPLDGFDAIHASPPCQAFSITTNSRPENRWKYPDNLTPMRERLRAVAVPWVIENVPGAPMQNYAQVCGTGLGMKIQRHRWFESNAALFGTSCEHGQNGWNADLKHSTGRKKRRVVVIGEYRIPFDVQCEAMGIDWMTLPELSEAIPPSYTEWVGSQLLAALEIEATA